MARYSNLLGANIQVQYRAGVISLTVSGALVADTGRSIFLEQHLEQRGKIRYFRWEIPYQYIVRLAEKSSGELAAEPAPAVAANGSEPTTAEMPVAPAVNSMAAAAGSSADSATSAGDASTLLPLQNRPKTA